MKYIELSQGKQAIVDDEDYKMLSSMKWHVRGGYATHSLYRYPLAPKTLSMHKLILEAPTGKVIDHINGDKLDNRRDNLRVVTQSQNMMNKIPAKNTKSGYKGVTFDPRSESWQARITVARNRMTIGSFRTAKEAGIAYAKAAKELHGEYMHHTTRALI